jgi:hypothetical protein
MPFFEIGWVGNNVLTFFLGYNYLVEFVSTYNKNVDQSHLDYNGYTRS